MCLIRVYMCIHFNLDHTQSCNDRLVYNLVASVYHSVRTIVRDIAATNESYILGAESLVAWNTEWENWYEDKSIRHRMFEWVLILGAESLATRNTEKGNWNRQNCNSHSDTSKYWSAGLPNGNSITARRWANISSKIWELSSWCRIDFTMR